jgi:DNA-binding beta-propeller fold protein YncE
MSACRRCNTLICVPPDDLRSYNLQGLPPAPLPPALPPEPPARFGNDPVQFCVDCGDEQSLNFDGTLPGWITLDAELNCLIGAANTFRAATKAAANALAQAALDEFVNSVLMDGALHCGDCSGTPAIETVIATGGAALFGIAYAPQDNRMFVGQRMTTNPSLFVVDCATNTVVNTLVFAGQEGINQISYGSGQNKIYAVSEGTTALLHIIDPATLAVSTINFPEEKVWFGLAYDALRDRLYISDAIPGSGHVCAFNCASGTFDGTIYNSGTATDGFLAYASNSDRIYLATSFSNMQVINPASLTASGSVTIPVLDFTQGVSFTFYSAIAGLLVSNHRGNANTAHIINPLTDTVVGSIGLGVPENLIGAADHLCRSRWYLGIASNNPRAVKVYTPTNPATLETTIAMPNGLNSNMAAYCTANSRVYFVFDTGIHVLT